jgi:hypothetical protein
MHTHIKYSQIDGAFEAILVEHKVGQFLVDDAGTDEV